MFEKLSRRNARDEYAEVEDVELKASKQAFGPALLHSKDDIDTIISEDIAFVGTLMSKGIVTVEGTIQGDMYCAEAMISDTGEVLGSVIAENVIIAGKIEGDVYARSVNLESTAYVLGDVVHTELGMELDAVFEGSARRKEDPLSAAPSPNSYLDIVAPAQSKNHAA